MEYRRHEATIVTPPTAGVYPVTVAQAKAYAGVSGDTDDQMIESLLTEAVDFFQRSTGHQLFQATYSQVWDGFPAENLELDWAPVASVSWLKYYAQDGTLTTIDTDDYWVSLKARPPVIMPIFGTSWPDVQEGRPESVQIEYVAGYADVSDMPQGILTAVKQLVSHLYKRRYPVVSEGGIPKDMPYTLNALLGLHSMRGYR